jgi:hypothetical protein
MTDDAPMVELRFVIRTEFGDRRRYIVDPAEAAAWETITDRENGTIRDQDIAALATLGIEVVQVEADQD